MTRELQILLAIYTAGITRSRREYEDHPISRAGSCPVHRDCYYRRGLRGGRA